MTKAEEKRARKAAAWDARCKVSARRPELTEEERRALGVIAKNPIEHLSTFKIERPTVLRLLRAGLVRTEPAGYGSVYVRLSDAGRELLGALLLGAS